MLKSVFTLLCLLIGSLAQAAGAPLFDALDGALPIVLQQVEVRAELNGSLAHTTVRLQLHNPNGRALEGQLQFPLFDGQQVTAFALDIDGAMRSAVPVPKQRGRQILDDAERRGADPALLDNTQGNFFKLRVYPIAAHGSRTVELAIDETLARQGGRWRYRLPLGFADSARQFTLALAIGGSGAPPSLSGTLAPLPLQRDGTRYRAQLSKTMLAGGASLTVQLPASVLPHTVIERRDEASYFLTEIPVDAQRVARPLPAVVGLLWDSSRSRGGLEHEAEFAELARYFKAMDHGQVRVTRLRDRPEAMRSFTIRHGDWRAVRDYLAGTDYDGASALADWQPETDVGEYLLFSDGMLNYGRQTFPALAPGQRLYALLAGSGDSARLAALAERSGGRLLTIVPHTPGTAAAALLSEPPRLQLLAADGVADLQIDAGAADQGVLRIAGKLLAPNGNVSLELLQAGKRRQLTVPLAASAPQQAGVGQLWAGYRLRALAADGPLHQAEMTRLGQQFGVVTPGTSLIVLDSLADYLRYELAPPPALQAGYAAVRAERERARQTQRRDQLAHVLRAFGERQAWWQRDFPKGAPPAPASGKERAQAAERAGSERATPAAMMAAPAPPALVGAAPPGGIRVAVAAMAAPPPSPETEAGAPRLGISLKKWRADAPYIRRLHSAAPADLYALYRDLRADYANSSAFYLDVADLLLEKGQRALGLPVLSNLAEMDLDNRAVLRILGYRLLQAGEAELALPVFEQVLAMADDEPQSFRDLGLAHAAAGHHQAAVDQLLEVVLRPWQQRFADIDMIALAELNAIVAKAAAGGTPVDTARIDARLLRNLALDVRAVLSWDADNSDMDLWVTDPNGEKCYYGHQDTYQGGHMSHDATVGYGPEEFSLRHAKPGRYQIEVNFYGHRQQVVAGATTLQVNLTTGFGTPQAQQQLLTLRLRERGESVFVGQFEVKP